MGDSPISIEQFIGMLADKLMLLAATQPGSCRFNQVQRS
jgi:hypothetical protein